MVTAMATAKNHTLAGCGWINNPRGRDIFMFDKIKSSFNKAKDSVKATGNKVKEAGKNAGSSVKGAVMKPVDGIKGFTAKIKNPFKK